MSTTKVRSSGKKKKATKVCCVSGCESNSKLEKYSSLSWHKVPEGELETHWITAARLSESCRYIGAYRLFLCSLHFKPSDFEDKARTVLKKGTVPSRFPWLNDTLRALLQCTDSKTLSRKKRGQFMLVKPDIVEPEMKMDFDDEIEVIEEPGAMEPDAILPDVKRSNSESLLMDAKRKCAGIDCVKIEKSEIRNNIFISKDYLSNFQQLISGDLMHGWTLRMQTMNTEMAKLAEKLKSVKATQGENKTKIERASHLINLASTAVAKNSLYCPRPQNSTILSSSRSLTQVQGSAPFATKEEQNVDGLQIVSMVVGAAERNLPPPGVFKRSEITLNSKVYGMKSDLYGVWHKALVIDILGEGPERKYKIKFEPFSKAAVVKACSAKEIAYDKPSDVRLPFGKRIIASYRPEDKFSKPAMYAGIIAEPPKSTNRFRYLVFFDDGYAQYTEHCDVRVVCDESKNVWEDIHPESRDFIKGYCEQFPERPMLKLQKNQVIKTEFNSGWWFAKVVDVDASMVRMYFEQDNRYEWIYRGSTRLAPLYNELEKAKHNRLSGKVRRHILTARRNKDQPYVEYTVDDDEIVLDSDESDSEKTETITAEKPAKRNVAIKSTSQTKKTVYDASKDAKRKEGEVYFIDVPNFTRPKYEHHNCGTSCRKDENRSKYEGQNPLRIPLFLGWERQVKKYRLRTYNFVVQYRAPCGRILRNSTEVEKYLLMIESSLTVDLFTFEPALCPLQAFRVLPNEIKWSSDDITEGKENVPIPCINCIDDSEPSYLEYATERFAGKGVNLNLDKEFLCGCDCTDNCQDPLKCQCQQLTIKAYSKEGNIVKGYKHRRLTELIITGIYECNSRCSCNSKCPNRVVQNGLQIRLQMFKTERKGWGIRCLDDLDAGQFICIYAGQLLTEQGADEDGNQYGDEYLAELDHIEVAEKTKEGYESDVPDAIDIEDPEEKSDSKDEIDDSDDESDASSLKTNSSQNSVSHDSDPEFEGAVPTTTSVYDTRSKNKTVRQKKRISLFSDPDFYPDSDSNSCLQSGGDERKELPDLDTQTHNFKPIIPRPLSPTAAAALENLEIGRKPKLDDFDTKRPGVHMNKKLQKLLKQPLPPPMPPEYKNKCVSLRSYFGETDCYIMDAKNKGNIGRYLNHSCNPNAFVQNVFFDTHDLRFPTVAFFAANHIKAGTELTWDYHYEVNSVPGKCLYCYCESSNCRGRLL